MHEDRVTRFGSNLQKDDTAVYVNFLGDEGAARVREAYPGSTWQRLTAIKRRYDPSNFFRLNHNIPIAAEPLQSVRTAATVRVRGGKVAITDGPFAETKETVGGFFLINAKDMNEATQVAAKWPSARLGSIEVRPIEDGLKEDKRYA